MFLCCAPALCPPVRYDDEFGRWHLPLRQRNVVGANTCAVAQLVNQSACPLFFKICTFLFQRQALLFFACRAISPSGRLSSPFSDAYAVLIVHSQCLLTFAPPLVYRYLTFDCSSLPLVPCAK